LAPPVIAERPVSAESARARAAARRIGQPPGRAAE
jgi:hypothetical protein